MAGLPDGTYLIVNGGQHGAAGFGLQAHPTTTLFFTIPPNPSTSV